MAHQPLGGRPVGVVRAHHDVPFPTEHPQVKTTIVTLVKLSVILTLKPKIQSVAERLGMTPAQVSRRQIAISSRLIDTLVRFVLPRQFREASQSSRSPSQKSTWHRTLTSRGSPMIFLTLWTMFPQKKARFDSSTPAHTSALIYLTRSLISQQETQHRGTHPTIEQRW